jgi:L-alanine-DL-glutamate epimerase-like enolase superfamily enzyme
MEIVIHTALSPVGEFAAAHLAATMPNFLVLVG